jgi:ribosomal protein S18 acetylase RimI-like enzyme
MSTQPDRRAPWVEIRPFGPSMPPRIADVSDLHSELLPSSPVVKLGRPFLECFYYRVLPAQGHIFGAVAYVDGFPAGFIAATADSQGFLRRAARQHFFSIAWLVVQSILAKPSRVVGLWEAVRLMRARTPLRSGSTLGEILSVGVRPGYRKGSGGAGHLASRLMSVALEQLRSAGAHAVVSVVDQDNAASRRYFESHGFRQRERPPEGWAVPSIELSRDLPENGSALSGIASGDKVPVTPEEPASGSGTPVSIVIPCCNEAGTLPQLAYCLSALARGASGEYRFRFLFVDDGSTDETWDALQKVFGQWPGRRFLRHTVNRGIASAILTGFQEADTEIVCSMDADCSYDPRQLVRMIPLLAEGVDVVTASPHHPLGRVAGVPEWRLALSRAASALHRRAVGGSLYTYSSCFRVYRRSSVAGIRLTNPGFPGIAEMLHAVAIRGGRIVEFPATLEVRANGASKVRVVRTVAGHLKLLYQLLRLRRSGRSGHSQQVFS